MSPRQWCRAHASVYCPFPAPLLPCDARAVLGMARRSWSALGIFLVLGCFVACKASCDGVMVSGHCETACRDSLCASGSRCVDNACSATCTTTAACASGKTCEENAADQGGRGRYCIGHVETVSGTAGDACTASKECATSYGFRCVDRACTLTCDAHSQCGAIGSCTGTAKDAEGVAVRTCQKDSFPHGKGQYGSTCPRGDASTADGGGAECDTGTGFVCVGIGPGDIDAYCTQRFCRTDDDCPSGVFSAADRAAEPPCSDSSRLRGAPDGP